jgi:hypothetical protein
VSELVSPARRQLEVDLPVGQAGQVTAEVEELLCNKMDDVAFALDLSV